MGRARHTSEVFFVERTSNSSGRPCTLGISADAPGRLCRGWRRARACPYLCSAVAPNLLVALILHPRLRHPPCMAHEFCDGLRLRPSEGCSRFIVSEEDTPAKIFSL